MSNRKKGAHTKRRHRRTAAPKVTTRAGTARRKGRMAAERRAGRA